MFEEDTQNASLDAILKKRKNQKTDRPKKIHSPAKPARTPDPQPPSNTVGAIVGSRDGFNLNTTMQQKRKKSRIRWTIIAVVLLVIIGYGVWWFLNVGHRLFAGKSPFDFLRDLGQLTTADDRPLAGEEAGGVNILLMGIGGENHQGGTLADTIILATLRPGNNADETRVSLLSIPRDFNVYLPEGYQWRKINSAYAYGELQGEGTGAAWMLDAVEEWTGETVPYYMVIDFSGFEKAIDEIGGVDVNIERSFTDSQFPDDRFGYLAPLRFEAGLEHMDGKRALQFARSRYGTNNEGGDFARAARQQKVLVAIKERVSELKISSNLTTIISLLDTFSLNFKTNMEPWELKRLYDIGKTINTENVKTQSLNYETGLICSEIVEESGASILTLCPGKTKGDVHRFVASRFEQALVAEELPAIEIQNATRVNFLARTASQSLNIPNADITTNNFPGNEVPSATVIHDLTGGTKPVTLQALKNAFPGNIVLTAYPYPEDLPEPKPDFVVVLGTEATEQFGP